MVEILISQCVLIAHLLQTPCGLLSILASSEAHTSMGLLHNHVLG